MSAKTIIIVGVVCFIAGGIFTAGGLYISQSYRVEYNKDKIAGIEYNNNQLRKANEQLKTNIESLRNELTEARVIVEIERANNQRLIDSIQSIENGNIRAKAIINEVTDIINSY